MTGREPTENTPDFRLPGGQGPEGYLESFLPRFRRAALAGALPLPGQAGREAAILCIDVVGFTALTDEIAGREQRGAEQLSEIIDSCLAGTAAVAAEFGGEVIAFAGDAAWIAWFADDSLPLRDAVRLAAEAALATQGQPWRAGGRVLQLKATIGAGPVQHFELGGLEGEWHGLLTGAPITQIRAAGRQAAPGIVIAAPEAWELLREVCEGVPTGGATRVTRVVSPLPAPARPADQPPIDAQRLRGTVPRAVLQRGADGYGEFRTVSVAFILLKDLPPGEAALGRLQAAVAEAEAVAARLEGEIYQCLADEKGVTIVMAFGLPSLAHQNDAARAIEAAIAMRQTLAAAGIATAIGIATGRMFCTVYGNAARRQFAMIGPRMNLAARLMEADAGVVCDAETLDAARRSRPYAARALPPMVVRGKADPVAVFAPSDPPDLAVRAPDMGSGLAGREDEKRAIGLALAGLKAGQGTLILIEGEAGSGKSTLLASALASAAANGIRTAIGAGDEIDRELPLVAWRHVLRDLVGPAVPAEALANRLGEDAGFAPLLNDLLARAAPETETTARLTDEGRAATIRRMMLRLLRDAAESGPLLVAIEDVHWLDPTSWELLLALAEAQLPALVLATWRSRAGAEAYLGRLAALPGLRRLPLGGLAPEQTASLVARAMTAGSVAADVVSLVQQRTSGNPLFIGELTRVLADHGVLSVVGGEVGIAATAGLASADLDQIFTRLGVPPTLEGVVTARLDRLPGAELRVLRAGSVVGASFTLAEVAGVSGAADPAALGAALDGLVSAGMLNPRTSDDEYGFRHAVLRDVTYGTIAFAERQALHRRFAEWSEAAAPRPGGSIDASLGQHFREAGDAAKASFYLRRAGEQALHGNSNMEALSLLSSALALDNDTDPGRRAQLELALGEVHQRLSHYAETRAHSEAGLRLLGYPVPPTAAGLVLPLLREIGVQIVHCYALQLRPGRVRPADPRRLMASGTLGGLVETYFYLNATIHSLYVALRSLNLAEGLGPTPELARGYAIVGTMAGFAKIRKWARRCGDLALATLAKAPDAAAAWWVPLVVGVARMSAGNLDGAEALMHRVVEVTQQIGDRRHWRDGVENLGIIAAMRGNWNDALEQVARYRASALGDKDQRYIVAADREQAYYLLQTGQFTEAGRGLALIAAELERGVAAEEAPARQDLHAMQATLAFEAGDFAAARVEAAAALVLMRKGGTSSFPNMYWAIFLVARVYLNLWRMGLVAGAAEAPSDRQQAAAACKALKAHTGVHLVGRPSARLMQGAFELVEGKPAVARAHFSWAASRAQEFGMNYWRVLAEAELARLDGGAAESRPDGLPLFPTLGDKP